jgi:hypothetical protein
MHGLQIRASGAMDARITNPRERRNGRTDYKSARAARAASEIRVNSQNPQDFNSWNFA